MNDKQLVISSYSDLSKASPSINKIHFRKFIGRKLLERVLSSCPNAKSISVSSYAYRRLDDALLSFIRNRKLVLRISDHSPGRPNLLRRMLIL